MDAADHGVGRRHEIPSRRRRQQRRIIQQVEPARAGKRPEMPGDEPELVRQRRQQARSGNRRAAARARAGRAPRSPSAALAGEEAVSHVEILVDDHARGRPSLMVSSAAPARSTARSTGSRRPSATRPAARRRACRPACPAEHRRRTMRVNSGTCARASALLEAGGRPGKPPRRWRTNWSITVSAVSCACSL